MIIVADTSPLNYLIQIKCDNLLRTCTDVYSFWKNCAVPQLPLKWHSGLHTFLTGSKSDVSWHDGIARWQG